MLKKLVAFQDDSKVKHETIILSKNVKDLYWIWLSIESNLVNSTSNTPWTRDSTSMTAFLNRRAAARYRALASIIPGHERFSWNLSF